jgi:hypothetical protein
MTATMWVLVAVGTWLVVMGTMGLLAGLVKDTDRSQSALLAATRRDRFTAPLRPARVIDARPRARRVQLPRSYVGG